MLYVVARTRIESTGESFDEVTADNELVAFDTKEKAIKYLKESYEDELDEFLEEMYEEGYAEYDYTETKAYYSWWNSYGAGECVRFEVVELKIN